MTRRDTGDWAERLARLFLERKGYRIRATNYHCRYGEIDIIAEDGTTLVFVEVRSKRSSGFGGAAESITPAKRRKLRLTVDCYLAQQTHLPQDWRLDALLVTFGGYRGTASVEHIEHAVSGSES